MYDGQLFLSQNLVKIPSSFVSFEKADEIENFYSNKDVPSAARAIKQCVETINKNAGWRHRDVHAIRLFLSNF